MSIETDVAIVGAGPVGLFAAFELGQLGMKSAIVDSLGEIGGQCSALYPEKPIYDIPAHPKILGAELVHNLEKQIAPFKPKYLLSQRVESFKKHGEYIEIITSNGSKIQAKAMIIAAGCGAFGPNRPPIANIEEYEGKSVSYLIKSPQDFAGKRVAIAGGGDSAIDWALALSDVAEKIYLIHRRKKFRAAPSTVAQLEKIAENSDKFEFVIPYQLQDIKGSDGQIEKLVVSTLDGQEKFLAVDCLLPFFGLAMELGPIADWGLNLDKKHIKVNPSNCQTNIERIYAVGDIATYPGKLKLILCGFSEVAMAAHHIYKLVFDKELHFEYSTSKASIFEA